MTKDEKPRYKTSCHECGKYCYPDEGDRESFPPCFVCHQCINELTGRDEG